MPVLRPLKVTVFLWLALVCLSFPAGLQGGQAYSAALAAAASPENQPATTGVEAKGYLVPVHWANLSFPVKGPVAEIMVKEWDPVAEGEPLARIGDDRKYQAKVAAAELELLLARQASQDLNQNAGLELAQAEKKLADLRKAQALARDKVQRLKEPVDASRIEQTRANMRLAETALKNWRRNLYRAEKFIRQPRSPFWRFIPRHAYQMQLVFLRSMVTRAEARYNDAIDKYNDLIQPVDEIDLQQAESDLASLDSQIQQATRDRDALLNGPDPDTLAQAEARLKLAGAALEGAQADLRNSRMTAPFTGQVLSIPAKTDQWVQAGEPVMVLADASQWMVEIDDLKENDAPRLQTGQEVRLSVDALPDLELNGTVQSISLLNNEKDGDPVYTVKISVKETDPRLRWGMTVRVQ